MLYDEYLTHAELQRWILDVDVAWGDIDAASAREQPEVLDQIRDSALIESYFPVYTSRLMRAFWDQVDVTAVFSIQLYESYKHFYAFNRYLEAVAHRPVTEADIVAIRRPMVDQPIAHPIAELARYMISEHFAAYYFLRLSRQAREPVLQQIAGFVAKDEFRHTQFACDLLEPRVRASAAARDEVLTAGLDFRHIGHDVLPAVPIAEKNDLPAILTLNRKIERLCGVSLADHAKIGLHAGD